MISKSEMKVAIAAEFEQGFGDAKRAAEDDSLRWDGAKTSLRGAEKAVEALLGHIAKDVKEGLFTNEQAEAAQSYVRKAVGVCDNLRLKAEVHEQRARGRMEAMSMAANMASRMGQQAQRRLDVGGADLEPQETAGALHDRHPGNRLEALRARGREPQSEAHDPGLAVPQEVDEKAPVPQKSTSKKAPKRTPRSKKD